MCIVSQEKRRDFNQRDEWEQESLLADTWCSTCNEASLGIENPSEYEVKGVVYLEGTCPQCGEQVVMTINEELV